MEDTLGNANKAAASTSRADAVTLLRALLHRVDTAGEMDPGLLEVANAIAVNTAIAGIQPQHMVYTSSAAEARKQLIPALPSTRIIIFDMFLSTTASAIFTFVDQDNTTLLSPFYSGASSGFSRFSARGIWLPTGKALCYSVSAGTAHGIDIEWARVNA